MRRTALCLCLICLALLANGCETKPQVAKDAKKGQLIEVNASNFESVVMKSDKPVLVDFWAPWCGPCKALVPTMEEMAGKYEGKIVIAKLNVDDNQELARKYNVKTIPRLIYFKNGENVIDDGAVGSKELDQEIQSVIKLK